MATWCKKCLLTDRVEDTIIDENRLCDYCAGRRKDEWESRFGVTELRKQQLRTELERAMDDGRGKYDYDCVLALSGGKDSSYLLYHLLEERQLRVLAVHVNTPFESNVAEQNMKVLREKLDFDLEIVDPGEGFYMEFYRTLFSNPVREGYIKTICYVCGPFFTGCCLKVAAQRNIPLVFLGVSPNQPDNMFFEWGKDVVQERDWIPELFKSHKFSDEFRCKFWNPLEYPEGTAIPRLIAPLHVMEYNAEKIMEELSANGILRKKDMNPMVTNCALNWPMVYLDTKLLGHNPYIKEFSSKVRRGESSRAFWKSLLWLAEGEIKLGIFRRRTIRAIEKALDMRFSDCPTDRDAIARSFEAYP